MDLFDHLESLPRNIINQDGVIDYYGQVLSDTDAHNYFDILYKTIDWKNDETIIFGKRIVTKRKVAWYGDNPFEYTYSNTTKKALLWTQALKELKTLIERATSGTYNSCLLNLYHDGSEGMTWHSDDENDLEKNGVIASLSLGAERKFSFKHKKTKKTVSLNLENGSLIVMKGVIQRYWLHQLPRTRKVTEPRINLTFRTIVGY